MTYRRWIAIAAACGCVVGPHVYSAGERAVKPNGAAGVEPQAGPLILVRDGGPAATIVISTNATKTVRFAVEELNEHLTACTGTGLPVVKDDTPVSGATVQIGATTLTERFGLAPRHHAPDNWSVWRVGDALVLSGGDSEGADPEAPGFLEQQRPFGTLYATYEFLERVLGVRWYWPGKLGMVAPKHTTVALDHVQWDGAPTFDARVAYYNTPVDPELTREESNRWWRRLRRGTLGGHPIGNHSFNDWPEKFAKTHPEYFALQRDGNRLLDAKVLGGHVCHSNPDVVTETVREKRSQFDATAWNLYARVMPGDGFRDYGCRCEPCVKARRPDLGPDGIDSQLVWGFVNKVAAEVRKTHPDRFICCSSYNGYRAIPEEIAFEPNVAVTLCIGVAEPDAMRSAGWRDAYTKRITGWSLKVPNVYMWDYWDVTRQFKGQHGAPAIFPHTVREGLRLERGRVRGRVIELPYIDVDGRHVGGWADWLYDALNVYVAFRLMWNMDQDVDAMLEEFYRDFYGPAGPYVRRFYDAMEAAYMDPQKRAAGWGYQGIWTTIYPPSFVKETMACLRQAEQVTRGREPYHARAAKTLKGFAPFETASRRWAATFERPVKNESVTVPSDSGKPVIDGDLSDPCWQTAAVAGAFCDSYNSAELHAQTELRFVCDAKTLYVAIRAPLSGPTPRRTLPAGSQDGTVWMGDDSVELFFVEGIKKHQFVFAPDNVYMDKFQPDSTKDTTLDMMKWDCRGLAFESKTGAGEWTAEVAIPLASLEIPAPTQAEPWRVNFCRNHFYKAPGMGGWQQELSCWRPTFGSFHNVERFGTMWFE